MAKRHASKKSPKATKTGGKKGKACSAGKQSAAYRMFCTEQQTHRQGELSSMSQTELTKHLADEWKNLSAHQKQTYLAEAPATGGSKKKHHAGAKAKGVSKKKGHAKKTKKAAHHQADDHSEAD